ncbi:PREDICTED: uncharacterized protein LOC108567894 [Nicrophorus vespilloides]|uniref:Uncharacterized protein LOC108567894 n=1 Tax=Nicrophorus vespilloides TaxID=110193 RepID=A0ABM1NBA0_NICVS|nr:PREDICTED: uncharacterized protein LOC108567894 [Nicrophorus vespilloides]
MYSGHKVYCMQGQVCNVHNVYPCNPCIYDDYKCVGNHECDNDDLSSVYIENMKYKCGEYNECNIRDENLCEPCIEKKCPEPRFFRCGKDKDTAIIFNFVVPCVKGTVCNRHYKQPCKPCIQEVDDDDDDDDEDDDNNSDYDYYSDEYYNYFDEMHH